ncbi:WD40-repeat protein (notchless protein), related protein [Rhizoctonia solani 123E]|uniref:WD40-repeat protein (Notchless protein), related protein n=1 Tax=Rhizoctonia solani 123E TaxID=1423351 RepID=A0A074RR02_9AGAM|nr:WD40-repeat protein (notchless protein), related protein [Rhizoctonia solani 123E]
MWISGQAGIGKTAIATSLCQRLDSIRALAGSFFCRRDDPGSSDPLTLINNLACEMAMNCPTYAHEVFNAIRLNPKLCSAHLGLRYQGLVKRPLKQLKYISMPTTLVVIVDGLDECGDEDARGTALLKLYEMSRLVPWLKVIVTSRPLGDLQKNFEANCPHGTVVHLQDYDAAPDIRAYMQGQLGRLAETEKWPAGSIKQLCSMSQGVFLWATLATRYVKKAAFTALPRLQKMLNNQTSSVTDHFDALYTRILETTIIDGDQETKDAYLRCIGSIIVTSQRHPSIVPDLQYLLLVADQVDQSVLEQIIKNLAQLLVITNGHIRFLHASFKDFISDSSRSGSFYIPLDQCQVDPAASCLKLMKRELRFNICQLESSHLLNSQVPDLKLRIQSHIRPTLKYACLHWIDHFICSPNQAKVEAITQFMEGPQLMYWIEVLSLLGRLDVAIGGLANLESLELAQYNGWSLIRPWIKDARRLLLSFYDAIATSTPHLYISALAFAPSRSPTAHRMRAYFPNTVTIAKDPGLAWHPCVKTIAHPHSVQSLSMSPDGFTIVVGYANGSLAIWDLQTGTRISESLVGHDDSVSCVAHSPNGNLIASGSYDTSIRVWDVADRLKSSHALTGHSGAVYAVAFSPDSTVIASGSSDRTVRLWGSKSMCAIQEPYLGHSNTVSTLAFSPDGTQLVSGSWDKTIRVWSVASDGQRLTENPILITGHSDSVTCIAFSPDGSKIASGSTDKTMQMWDSWTGKEVECCTLPVKHSDSVNSIAFSSNGGLVISTSLDGRIHLRNATTLEETVYPFGHTSSVEGVAFSPDGTYIVSGSTDMTTRVWEVTTLLKPMTTDPLVGHSSPVHCVAISSDGTRIISGSADHTVRMWDAQTGAQMGKPYTGHSSFVYGLAFTLDGTRFVSGSIDMTLKLWDTKKQALVKSHQHQAKIRCVASAPDGTLIAFGSDDEQVYLWDPKRWKIIGGPLEGHSDLIWSVAFSPDGACLASGSSKAVLLWDTRSHSCLGKIASSHTQPIRSIALSPCGTRLISGSDDNTVRLWDIKGGSTVLELIGHSSNVSAVAFSPDGSCVASASFDNTIRLWNSKTGQSIGQPLVGHSKRVKCLTFSPDGGYLVSGSEDNTIRAWSLDTYFRQANDTQEAFSWPMNPCELLPHADSPGWVTEGEESLVFWLPLYYQQPDLFPGTHPGVPRPRTFLDYSKLVHGTAWTAVALDSIKNSG